VIILIGFRELLISMWRLLEIPSYRVVVEFLDEPYRSLVKELCVALQRVFMDKLVSVVLFGSVARGEARVDSDVDLLIVARACRSRGLRGLSYLRELRSLLSPLSRSSGLEAST
jgi:predicted nucleotidyltransferase